MSHLALAVGSGQSTNGNTAGDEWGRAADSARTRATDMDQHVGSNGLGGSASAMGGMGAAGGSSDQAGSSPNPNSHEHDPDAEQLELVGPCLRVRAKFDFVATDPSALSFNAGDVIEVITMLESGWWDGLLGDQRGWFPSNFVEDVLEGEGDEYVEGGVGEVAAAGHDMQEGRQGYAHTYGHEMGGAGASAGHGGLSETGPAHAPGTSAGPLRYQQQSHLDPHQQYAHSSHLNANGRSPQLSSAAFVSGSPSRQAGQYQRPDTRQTARSSMFPHSVIGEDEYGSAMNGLRQTYASGSGQSERYGMDAYGRYGQDYRNGDEYAYASDRARSHARSAMDISRSPEADMGYHTGYTQYRQDQGGPVRSLQSGIHLQQDHRGMDDFGMDYGGRNAAGRPARERETTGETIRSGSRSNGASGIPEHDTPRAMGRRERQESREDDWVPCLTPDGEVYYHNTLTGEECWHLPTGGDEDEEEEEDDDLTDRNSANDYPTPSTNARSSIMSTLPVPDDPTHSRSAGASMEDLTRGMQAMRGTKPTAHSSHPSFSGGDALVPPPTSRSQNEQPPTIVSRRAMREWNASAASRILSLFPPGQRHSMASLLETVNDALREVLEAAVAGSAAEEEMSRASDLRSASGFADAIRREDIAADALHIAHRTLLSALRELLRAFGYIGPIDRIEGMPRPSWTSDMTLIGSIGVFASNVHAATTSKKASLAFTAQPSGRGQQGSAWQDVSRSAYRLRDVLGRFPEMITAEAGTIAIGETPFGKELECWIGARGAGELCNGRWGFGGNSMSAKDPASKEEAKAVRKLDQAMVQEAKHVQAEFDSVIRGRDARRSSASTGPSIVPSAEASMEDVLELLRIAERFNGAIHHVDIASCIDLDGQQPQLASPSGGHGETARNDDLRAYADFVEQGRLAVVDFDKATGEINEFCAEIYLALCNGAPAIIPELSQALASSLLAASRSLGAILAITAEQATLTSTTPIVGRIGHRSARFAAANASSSSHLKSGQYSGYSSEQRDRPESMSSLASRGSGRSRGSRASRSSVLDGMRHRVRGIEDDFQASEDLMDPHTHTSTGMSPARGKKTHGRSGMSNSGSQSSLANIARTGQAKDASAESSSTSLPGHGHNVSISQRTESDSGSVRGNNRTSFMKNFMRGRSDSDAEPIRPNPRTKSKKLAKLLGDDVLNSPLHNQVGMAMPPISMRHESVISPRYKSGFSPTSTVTPSVSGMSRGGGSSMIPEVPAYLGDDYIGNELVLDDKGGVKAGTMRALVVRLTQHGTADTAFTQAFMLTFRSFIDGELLLDLLIARYHVEPPEGLDEYEQTDWVKQKQTPIRLRVANCMRQWLDNHYQASEDEPLLDRIEHFASVTLVADGFESLSKTLLNIAARRRRGEEPNQRRIISGGVLSPPAPFLPRSMSKNPQLTDIHPVELARQLTIFEFQYFQRIKIVELLNRSWQDEDVGKAPTTRATIHMSNKVAAFITWSILQPKDVKGRGAIIKHWLSVYTECKNLNNFSTIASLCAGINSSPINRMKRTLETVTGKWLTLKNELDGFMDSTKNFSHYKETLKAINPPCVPFLGFYLTALIFIEDGNKDRKASRKKPPTGLTPSNSMSSLNGAGSPSSITPGLVTPNTGTSGTASSLAIAPGPSSSTSASGSGGGTLPRSGSLGGTALAQLQEEETEDSPPEMRVVNFFKRGLAAEICRDVQQYQSQPYNLAKCRPVWEFIMKGLDSVEGAGDLYDLSLVVEPREKEDEKVTRMLHESFIL